MRHFPAKTVALGGVLAALAQVIMNLGTLIPLATYVCPVLCMVILSVYLRIAGKRAAWTWYVAAAILSLLLSPDKEAAAVFVFLGYYPIIKPSLDTKPLGWLLKLMLFNAATLVMYALLIFVFGMTQVAAEFQEMGAVMTIVTLVLGNVTFFMLDFLLKILGKRKLRFGKQS